MKHKIPKICLAALLTLMISGGNLFAAKNPIRIAAIFALSGIAQKHNAPLIPMLTLGVEEINNRGGLLGRRVELIFLDNQSTPIGSAKAAQDAVGLDVTAVIGSHWSSHSMAIAPVLQEAGIPMLSPGSTNPEVTRIGSYIFRMCFLDSFQGSAMARFARKALRARSAAVIKNIDEKYCIELGDFFASKFKEEGGEIVWEGDYRGNAVDFSEILAQIKPLRPEVVYVPGYTRDSGLLIKQAAVKGIKTTFLGGDGWDEIQAIAGTAVEGSYQTHHWHPGVPFRQSRNLLTLYHEKYQEEIPNYGAPLAYDALMLLRDAVERAGSLEREKIREALADTKDFIGATGKIRFDENGDPQNKAVVVLQLRNGARHFVEMEEFE